MVINLIAGFVHMNSLSFHNLKKFLAFSRFEYTPLVQKDFDAKILPGSENYRMEVEDFLTHYDCVIQTRNPLLERVSEVFG